MKAHELIEILKKAPDADIFVSVDVSTCEEDWGRRATGGDIQEVIQVRDCAGDYFPVHTFVISVIGCLNDEARKGEVDDGQT